MRTKHTTCSIPSCNHPRLARSWCSTHYMRWRKYGDPLSLLNKNLSSLEGWTPEQRFWAKVDKSGDCWNWTAARYHVNGYGCFGLNGKIQGAHRVAWQFIRGPIPRGMWVLHRCDNRLCVRPEHLFLGTHQDNMNDMWRKGRGSPALGKRNGRYTKPERTAKGERHWSKTQPLKWQIIFKNRLRNSITGRFERRVG